MTRTGIEPARVELKARPAYQQTPRRSPRGIRTLDIQSEKLVGLTATLWDQIRWRTISSGDQPRISGLEPEPVVGVLGFEPRIFALSERCSNQIELHTIENTPLT